jgi:hypothetical protein
MGERHSHGPQTFTYDCSGLGKGFDDCDAKAAAQCGKQGYDVVSRTGDSVNNEMKRTMVVSCRERDCLPIQCQLHEFALAMSRRSA